MLLRQGKSIASTLLLLSFATAAVAQAANEAPSRNLAQEDANRTLVLTFYDRFFNQHDVAGASGVVADDYRQHNPDVPDGKAPFVAFFKGYFQDNPQSRAKVVRTATDGDLVYLHVHATNGAKDRGQAVLDIFRVDNGRITEHWDVIQEVPEKSANDNTMF